MPYWPDFPGRLVRQPLPKPIPPGDTGRLPRAQHAGRVARRADRRAEVEQGLGEIAGPGPGGSVLAQPGRRRRDSRPGTGKRRADPEHPRRHSLHVAVHRHHRNTEGDAGDCGRSVGADPRQGPQPRKPRGKRPGSRHRLRTSMQISSPGIISQPRPLLHDPVERGIRQVPHCREQCDESPEIRSNRRDGRLLQHDLAEPDVIRVSRLARQSTPWHAPTMPVIPVQQSAGCRA